MRVISMAVDTAVRGIVCILLAFTMQRLALG